MSKPATAVPTMRLATVVPSLVNAIAPAVCLVLGLGCVGWVFCKAVTQPGGASEGLVWWHWPVGVAGLVLVFLASAAPVFRPSPKWGSPEAQKVPAGRWVRDGYATTQTVEAIESTYGVTVVERLGDDRFVVQSDESTLVTVAVVVTGKPGPDGVEAVLRIESKQRLLVPHG